MLWGRSPCGERGLKSLRRGRWGSMYLSLPLRGAWIEIYKYNSSALATASLPLRGAWIEISSLWEKRMRSMSLPMWGVWIEIPAPSGDPGGTSCRSPHGERGLKSRESSYSKTSLVVAPNAGSVD